MAFKSQSLQAPSSRSELDRAFLFLLMLILGLQHARTPCLSSWTTSALKTNWFHSGWRNSHEEDGFSLREIQDETLVQFETRHGEDRVQDWVCVRGALSFLLSFFHCIITHHHHPAPKAHYILWINKLSIGCCNKMIRQLSIKCAQTHQTSDARPSSVIPSFFFFFNNSKPLASSNQKL